MRMDDYICDMKHLTSIIFSLFLSLAASARQYDITARRMSTADGMPTNIVSRIWQTQDGYMWFETRSGLCRWDGYAVQVFEAGTFSVPEKEKELRTLDAEWRREGKGGLSRHGKDGNVDSWQLIAREIIEYTNNDHFHVADVDESTEAVSTYGGGLYLYDKPSGELTRICKSDGMGIIDNDYLTGLYVDHTGCIWIVEDYLGVKCLQINSLHYHRHLLDSSAEIQDVNHVRSLAIATDGRVLAGNQTGELFCYDLQSQRAELLRRMGSRVYAIMSDRQGQLWIGTRGRGLFKGMQQTEGLPSPLIFSIKDDGNGGMWIAMLEGGVAHRKNNGSIDTFLETKDCHDVCLDGEGRWWVAAEDSLYVLTMRDGRMEARATEKGYFICLCTDSDGGVWAGSIGGGLMNCKTKERYTTASGLANNNVYSIVQDLQGKIWVGTEEGLSCVDFKTGNIQNCTFSENMLANVFNERSAICLPDGRLLFGTHYGIVEIDSQQFAERRSKTNTAITGLLVNGEQTDDVLLTFRFKYTENNLTFLFSNFEYATLESVLYQYRLDGYDKEWNQTASNHYAAYRNLPPGRYTFRVRSNNGKGVWGEETTLGVEISQPWWKTWQAWCVYIMALILIGWYVVRMLRLRRKLDIERRVSAFKRDFYNRIERELRNPVNVMQGAAENVQTSGTTKTTIQSLRRGSRRMLKLMDMIQQFHSLNDLEVQLRSEQDAMNEETEQRFRDIQQAIHVEENDLPELAPPPMNMQTILIVEDDEDNMRHITGTLNLYFRILGCTSTSDCEDLVEQKKPSLVIIDITNDEKNGRELTKRLTKEYPTMPVIHLSSFSDNRHQLLSLRSGATDYITKPFSGKVLLERLKKVIEHTTVMPTMESGKSSSPEILTDIRDKRFLYPVF